MAKIIYVYECRKYFHQLATLLNLFGPYSWKLTSIYTANHFWRALQTFQINEIIRDEHK